MIRRISLFAGPGSGKSTTAAWLFAELKTRNISIELISEYVKAWAHQRRKINEYDQIYLLGKQMHYEYRALVSGVKHIVTDSPTDLSAIYAKYYNPKMLIDIHLEALNREYSRDFLSLNIFLKRNDKPYITEGRYQTHQQAKEIDGIVLDYLNRVYPDNFYCIDYQDRKSILDLVLKSINEH